MKDFVRHFTWSLALACPMLALMAMQSSGQVPQNDYPTETRADYVFGCMSANGQTPDMLRKCSCSIDVIASLLPYDDYVRAETVIGTLQAGGRRVEGLRSTFATEMVRNLRRAQAEAEVRCF